ncbi:vWA domain-containing protein [Mucilaginibacter flavidus]|uniref:vWA domain-containing protein n=1 Tax=Mucilaginibacter flavidus TaxID=2949309 RepID=UPI0020925828|nr:von Willebrand factor type A domain-containing protein [Mucilaginibacter flavidus]MCO5950638.1 von Willebrand factor type A domain-containing protein [Mucilaginibacter flavidus]
MKKLLLFVLIFAGLTGFKHGNTRTITGTVYSKDDGLPLPGVSVTAPGTQIGAITNDQGKFTIKVPEAANNLAFAFVGYNRKTVKLGKTDTLTVYLETNAKQLNEVVVVGYGSVQGQDYSGYVSASAPAEKQTLSRHFSQTQDKSYKTVVTKRDDDDESYAGITENAFTTVKNAPLSTFSVDVDAASYSNVRRFINQGQMPPADAVRIEEMINYFHYNLPAPTDGGPVAIHTELSAAPWNTKHRLLRIGLKAKTIDAQKLPPSNLVFLIDVSGSMFQDNKLPLVKSSMKMLVEQLRPQDRVAIVAYAGNAGLVLPATSGDKKSTINDAIESLAAGGSTAGGEGLKLAYKIARENFMVKGNNRIVMCTDGDFNVGPSSDGDMEQLITKERDSKVAISIMGFGMGNYKDSKMETLADKGNGNYAYIDNITEAHKALVSEFGGTLFTIAKDVKLQVEFNPAKVQAYRLLGYEDRMLAKEDFNNDKKDAGDMGLGHTVTALYEIVPAGIKDDYAGSVDPLKYQKALPVSVDRSSDEMMTIKFRYKDPDSATSKLSQVSIKDNPKALEATSVDFRFAAAVAEFGMLLRGSQFKQQSTYVQAISLAKGAKGNDEEGYRSEFIRLAESAKSMANELASK